ncbi:NAD(P)/FAD-dependent oxidoreductase [Methylolobus aquaticus]
MRIAIIGSGIAGLTCAHELHPRASVTVFEAASYAGGHTRTVDVMTGQDRVAIDTGFIVFNDRTYPNFVRLMNECGVASQPTDMGFSFSCAQTGLEYNGHSLATLFAQRRNLFRPSFHRMIVDILRFNREAPRALEQPASDATLGDYLAEQGYHGEFIDHYLVPMGSAIWSAERERTLQMPLSFFVRFFVNHGLLSLRDRPQWRVIRGGSREYVKALSAPFADRIRLNCPVRTVQRSKRAVTVTTAAGREAFDQVIFACHSDQALRLLADPTDAERSILGALPYQTNDAVLHTDLRQMPRRSQAWAAWNSRRSAGAHRSFAVTYDMNRLQGIRSPTRYLVTLNPSDDIEPDRIIDRVTFHHPLFTREGMRAQQRWSEINGVRRTWFTGAYWGYGFHEDGVSSGLRVCRALTGLAPTT